MLLVASFYHKITPFFFDKITSIGHKTHLKVKHRGAKLYARVDLMWIARIIIVIALLHLREEDEREEERTIV